MQTRSGACSARTSRGRWIPTSHSKTRSTATLRSTGCSTCGRTRPGCPVSSPSRLSRPHPLRRRGGTDRHAGTVRQGRGPGLVRQADPIRGAERIPFRRQGVRPGVREIPDSRVAGAEASHFAPVTRGPVHRGRGNRVAVSGRARPGAAATRRPQEVETGLFRSPTIGLYCMDNQNHDVRSIREAA